MFKSGRAPPKSQIKRASEKDHDQSKQVKE